MFIPAGYKYHHSQLNFQSGRNWRKTCFWSVVKEWAGVTGERVDGWRPMQSLRLPQHPKLVFLLLCPGDSAAVGGGDSRDLNRLLSFFKEAFSSPTIMGDRILLSEGNEEGRTILRGLLHLNLPEALLSSQGSNAYDTIKDFHVNYARSMDQVCPLACRFRRISRCRINLCS